MRVVPAVTSDSMFATFDGRATSTPSCDTRGIGVPFVPRLGVDTSWRQRVARGKWRRPTKLPCARMSVERRVAAATGARRPSRVSPHERFCVPIRHGTRTVERARTCHWAVAPVSVALGLGALVVVCAVEWLCRTECEAFGNHVVPLLEGSRDLHRQLCGLTTPSVLMVPGKADGQEDCARRCAYGSAAAADPFTLNVVKKPSASSIEL